MRTRAAYHVFSHLILLLALSAAERTPSASPALRAGNLRLLAHNNPSPTSVPSLTPAPSPVPVTPVVNGATFTALSALYSATNGDGWSDKDNWMSGDPCTNSWSGITCRNVVEGTKTIGQLQRYGNNLVGSLPTELGDLVSFLVSRRLPLARWDRTHIPEQIKFTLAESHLLRSMSHSRLSASSFPFVCRRASSRISTYTRMISPVPFRRSLVA